MVSEIGPAEAFTNALYPPSVPMMVDKLKWEVPVRSLQLPLPLRCTAIPNPIAAAAARTFLPPVEVVRDEATLPLRCRRSQILASALAGAYNVIRSSIMSHITFKMCQFVLIIYLRDYHYYFHLDIVVLWSFYGVLRLTYFTYPNLCPTDHFFGRLLMSQDISPNWMVLLEFTYRIIQKFFRIFPMSKIEL